MISFILTYPLLLLTLQEAAKDIKSNEAEEEEGNEKVEKIWVKSPDDSASYVSEVVGGLDLFSLVQLVFQSILGLHLRLFWYWSFFLFKSENWKWLLNLF